MKKPGKGLVLTLNLALPGLGQIVSGRWIAGGVMMLLAVAFFLLGVYFVFAPLFAMIRELIDNPGSAAEYKINLVNVFASFGLLVLVWIICIADGLRSGGKNKEHDHE